MTVFSASISKLYTPPTCTLEVTAQSAALSRWSRSRAVKSLRFLLSFEGSALSTREPIEVRGDQTQLWALAEVVTDYIQTLLAFRYDDLSIHANTVALSSPKTDSVSFQLRPRTLLTHELMLGNLATAQSGPSVLLKVSQLYDLASALEDCTADLQLIPSLVPGPWQISSMPLARGAAVVLLTVGLGTAAWQLLQPAPIALKPSGSNSKTALAPAAKSPENQAPLPPKSSVALKLPTVQLPTRSSNSLPPNFSTDKTEDRVNLFSSSQSSPAQKRTQAESAPKLPQPIPGDIASLPSINLQQPSVSQSQQDSFSSAARQGLSRTFKAAPDAPQTSAGQSTLFDIIPQVAQVRDYVASRWQPSSLPSKTLEYRIMVNADGSLGGVLPLGASAQQYLGQLPLPAAQSPFVAAIPSGTRANVRLLLRPDGTVHTFLDDSGQ